MSRKILRESRARFDFSEEALLRGIQHGSHDAFAAVYSRTFDNLVITALNYVKDIEVAKEIAQNIFLRLLEAPPQLVNANALRAYLHRSAINHAINHLRREKRLAVHHHQIALEFQDSYTEPPSEETGMQHKLHHAIDSLPPQCRRILKMSKFQNLKYKEIAEKLGIAEKTVENHIVSAFKQLRRKFITENSIKEIGAMP